eukprot:618222-Pyramimonas_sp.AAC.1
MLCPLSSCSLMLGTCRTYHAGQITCATSPARPDSQSESQWTSLSPNLNGHRVQDRLVFGGVMA